MSIAYKFFPVGSRDQWFEEKGMNYLKDNKDVFMDLFVTGPAYEYQ